MLFFSPIRVSLSWKIHSITIHSVLMLFFRKNRKLVWAPIADHLSKLKPDCELKGEPDAYDK